MSNKQKWATTGLLAFIGWLILQAACIEDSRVTDLEKRLSDLEMAVAVIDTNPVVHYHYYPVADSNLVVRMDSMEHQVTALWESTNHKVEAIRIEQNKLSFKVDTLQSNQERLTFRVDSLVIEGGLSGVILRWKPLDDAEGYKVYTGKYRQTVGGTVVIFDEMEFADEPFYSWESLPRGTVLAVTAHKNGYEGPYSEFVVW